MHVIGHLFVDLLPGRLKHLLLAAFAILVMFADLDESRWAESGR